ncbi:unnamed protein product, partial [Ectocarpus sp. 12 AP-2014]
MALAKGQSLASLQKQKGAVPGSAAADKPGPVIEIAGGDGTAPAAATAVPQGQASAAAASRGGVAGISPPPTSNGEFKRRRLHPSFPRCTAAGWKVSELPPAACGAGVLFAVLPQQSTGVLFVAL